MRVAQGEVQWLFPDGAGGIRAGHGTVRLPGAIPGDRVGFDGDGARGVHTDEAWRLLAPSPARVAPPCPHHDRCGGCDLAHAASEARLAWLGEAVARSLGLPALEVEASPRRDARARIKLTIDGGRPGYRGARSHDHVAIEGCSVARPEVRAALDRLRALPAPALAGLATVELRSDGERVVFAAESAGPVDRAALAPLGNVAVDGRAAHGDPTLWLDNGFVRLRASPRSFYQVNLELNRRLVGFVREVVRARGAGAVLDLYAGHGNLGLPLALDGCRVRAVEVVPDAVADLVASAAAAGIAGRVEAVVEDADATDPTRTYADAVILDPPRRGSGELLRRLVVARPPLVVLVSCDPRAAARDARPLREAGYAIAEARGFDLFPDTHHLEVVTVWERRAR